PNSLSLESLLELLDEESLRKDTSLPSPEWSSDLMSKNTRPKTSALHTFASTIF
ncbi:hypothetical protein IFM89_004897, partial [Coptis chinensis]